MKNLADAHLTYIGSRDPRGLRGSAVHYDVYGAGRGVQLGRVYRHYATWTARDDVGDREAHADTRWEAATALWGDR